jgi:hypothetical protein
MAKVIFVLQRKAGTTREECLDSWAGDDQIAFLSKLPGLAKWTRTTCGRRRACPSAMGSASCGSRATTDGEGAHLARDGGRR